MSTSLGKSPVLPSTIRVPMESRQGASSTRGPGGAREGEDRLAFSLTRASFHANPSSTPHPAAAADRRAEPGAAGEGEAGTRQAERGDRGARRRRAAGGEVGAPRAVGREGAPEGEAEAGD